MDQELNSGPDQLLQSTCAAIVTLVAQIIDAEPVGSAEEIKLPEGQVFGKRVMINATGSDGLFNLCRISIMRGELLPSGEVARIEYEHDKQRKAGLEKAYSVQSVRRVDGRLRLLENFLAEDEYHIREADFRPIDADDYAKTVLSAMQDWARFRAGQLRGLKQG